MAETTIPGLTQVTDNNLTEAAEVEVSDANADSRRATMTQLRTRINKESHTFEAPTTGGAAAAIARITKKVSSIANNSATAVLTITVPNAAHSARVTVWLTGSLGAGGAIGANEATESIAYNIAIARTAGVNAVASISSAFGESGSTAVSGAATIAVSAAMSSVSGAVGAVNTFTLNVTIARGSGSSDNHTCIVDAVVHNGNATGVTLS